MNTRPVWRLPYTFPRQNLSTMLGEIMAGTFSTNQDGAFSRSTLMKKEILIQCREQGLCQFAGEDCNAHLVPLTEITIIPQVQIQRGNHQ